MGVGKKRVADKAKSNKVKIRKLKKLAWWWVVHSAQIKRKIQEQKQQLVGPGWIVAEGGLWVTSFTYKYETSTTLPRNETTRCFVLVQN